MKDLKKLLGLLFIFCLVLTACQNNNTTEKSAEPATVETTETKESETVESTEAKEITLTDNIGREVTLPYPVKTAVVANRYNSELIRACGAIDKVIAVDMNTAQDREYWAIFDPDNTIGKGGKELNYEKIIELNPQVVVLPSNGAVEEAEQTLEPFGIKVFVISGYDTSDFKNQISNIGKMFGTEEQAEKFYNYFNDKLEYINTQLANAEKKTLYLEQVKDYQTTIPGDYFYDMQSLAGANNIFSEDYENINQNEIDPEVVIERNPEYIVKFLTADAAMAGTGLYEPPSKEQFQEKYNEIITRPGWESIDAVKNDNIFFMTQFSHGGASKLVGTMHIAKWMYPDLLPDLDPDEVWRAWMVDFQGFKDIPGHFYSSDELK